MKILKNMSHLQKICRYSPGKLPETGKIMHKKRCIFLCIIDFDISDTYLKETGNDEVSGQI